VNKSGLAHRVCTIARRITNSKTTKMHRVNSQKIRGFFTAREKLPLSQIVMTLTRLRGATTKSKVLQLQKRESPKMINLRGKNLSLRTLGGLVNRKNAKNTLRKPVRLMKARILRMSPIPPMIIKLSA
jgi:hypothetical protein